MDLASRPGLDSPTRRGSWKSHFSKNIFQIVENFDNGFVLEKKRKWNDRALRERARFFNSRILERSWNVFQIVENFVLERKRKWNK